MTKPDFVWCPLGAYAGVALVCSLRCLSEVRESPSQAHPYASSGPNEMPTQSNNTDIVVVGASAGGVLALSKLVGTLPHDLQVAIFIVLHVPPESKSMLTPVLARATRMTVQTAVDGQAIQYGHIYVAPADHHLTLDANGVRVTRGPLQNRNRPSIDVLFRSAATSYGTRVIGVVLTGFLNDGTAGLRAIKDFGGISVVQDPATALYPSMPENALRHVEVDHCVPLEQIPELLARLSARPRPIGQVAPERARLHRFEADADQGDVRQLDRFTKPSSYLCPDCGGALWEVKDETTRFRCRVGHGCSIEELTASQDAQVESALWAATRSLDDRAALSQRLAAEWRERNASDVVEHFTRRSEESARHAATLRHLLGLNGHKSDDTQ